jgi:hypothetical protein
MFELGISKSQLMPSAGLNDLCFRKRFFEQPCCLKTSTSRMPPLAISRAAAPRCASNICAHVCGAGGGGSGLLESESAAAGQLAAEGG